MQKIYVALRQNDKKWNIIGLLEHNSDGYKFSYTKGIKNINNFKPFGSMKENVITSKELFPFFSNRVLSPTRPEYKRMLEWMNLEEEHCTPLLILALTEGKRGTDDIELFSCPVPRNGRFRVSFFAHGVRYTHESNIESITSVKDGEQLYIMKDFQNDIDSNAFALRTGDPIKLLGYLPRYLALDVKELCAKIEPKDINISVVKNNKDAPMAFRYLCEIDAPWPKDFTPCHGDEYTPLDE